MDSTLVFNDMECRLFICWNPSGTYMASVIAVDAIRCWRKLYSSKQECVDDLDLAGLITVLERDDALESDFDTDENVMVYRAVAETANLENIGFLETTRSRLN